MQRQRYGNINLAQSTDQIKSSSQEPKTTSSLKKWKRVGVILMLLVIILVAGVAVVLAKVHQSTNIQSGPHNSFSDTPITSCLRLKQLGETKSGYYRIQPDKNTTTFETYCDMTTSGGGWTLVASVHENDILGKCTTADMWFNWEREKSDNLVSRNWENKFTFGNVKSATSSDYKNSGYYSIQASDVLVRHSPNNEEVENTKEETFLEYYTDNEFLKNYGGNLYSVYSRYYNLSAVPEEQVATVENNAEMLNALSSSANDIISEIPDFYRYRYDSSNSRRISGSSNDGLFSPYGMEIYTSSCNTIYYGNTYSCGNRDVSTSSRKTTPFFSLTTIGNHRNSWSSFYYRIHSYRYSNDTLRQYSSTLVNGNFTLNYNAYCRYGSSRPSLCDVMYAVSNKKEWKSSNFDFYLSSSASTSYYLHQYARSNPKNIVMGYTMLSRSNGLLVSQFQTENVLRKILAIISKFNSVAKVSCESSTNHLVQPVKYSVGSAEVLSVPTTLNDYVIPGYIQFRAQSREGIAFAFCPAVKVNTCDSKYVCVGGVGFGSSTQNYCNDYLYWNGGSSPDSLKFFEPGSTSRSGQLIASTIMIFYR